MNAKKVIQDKLDDNRFVTINESDFDEKVEVIQPTEDKNPIILIPGVGGSKLRAIFKDISLNQQSQSVQDLRQYLKSTEDKSEEMAYVSSDLNAIRNMSEYLWDRFDEVDQITKSHLDDYISIQPVPGLAGCDTMLDIEIFKNRTIGIYGYFRPIVNLLEYHGYVYGKDLFCFTYDWRQPMSCPQIQNQLQQLIKLCHMKSGKKVILIGHSLGGEVIDTYLRMHSDFNNDVEKFVALAVPFNGSSAKILQAQTQGYTLDLPIPYVTSKGIQCACGCMPWMSHYYTSSMPTFSQIFVKKLIPQQQQLEQKEQSSQQDQQIDKYQYITLHPEVYSQHYVPDMSFVIAQKIMREKSIDQNKIISAMRQLQKCCEPGAIEVQYVSDESQQDIPYSQSERVQDKVQAKIKNKINAHNAFEPNFKISKAQQIDLVRKDFTWESYAYYSHFSPSINQQYQFINNKFIKFYEQDQNVIVHTSMKYKQLMKNKQHSFRYTQLKDQLYQFFIARQYVEETTSSAIPKGLQKSKLACTAEFQDEELEQPWQNMYIHSQLDSKSMLELNNKMYPKGSLDYQLFHSSRTPYEIYNQLKNTKINFQQDSTFKFYSVNGYNVQTPFHLVFQKPITSYEEIPRQLPEYVYVSGDGTVLTTSALGDGYPDFVVAEKLCLENLTHFGVLSEERTFKFLIEEVLELQYKK